MSPDRYDRLNVPVCVTDRLGSGGWTGNASQGGSIATADADNQQAGSIDKT